MSTTQITEKKKKVTKTLLKGRTDGQGAACRQSRSVTVAALPLEWEMMDPLPENTTGPKKTLCDFEDDRQPQTLQTKHSNMLLNLAVHQ